jgi:pimeloyl-ACP methyl ester carboxylesterase
MLITNKDGTQTFFTTTGTSGSEVILLLHGIGADHRMWAPQQSAFCRCRVSSIDA